MNGIYQDNPLQVPADASSVRSSTGCAQSDDVVQTRSKRSPACRGENTRDGRGRMSAQSVNPHSVFVLAVDGKPLTPTTPAKARKLLKHGAAKKVWSKFGTFGIQLFEPTRTAMPVTALGIDVGTKFEGYAVVCGMENSLAVKLDLPDKKQIGRKLDTRRMLRRARRFRNCRRRAARFANRGRKGFLAPSQTVVVGSRLKILAALYHCYPITVVGLEDVKFNHAAHRWGANFSTAEIGKTRLRTFLVDRSTVQEFRGFETQEIRKAFGYTKTKDKGADKFTAHCTDALALACEVGPGLAIKPGRFVVVDDTYRPVRRRLHDMQPTLGGAREAYAMGTVLTLRKGLLIGTTRGKVGRLCGIDRGAYRYCTARGTRRTTVKLAWVSTQFAIRSVFPRCLKTSSSYGG